QGQLYHIQISGVTDFCGRVITPNPTTLAFQCGSACPGIVCPSNIVADCHGPGGTSVHYEVYLIPTCDTNGIVLVCSPPPDSIFPPGTTLVNCLAYKSG